MLTLAWLGGLLRRRPGRIAATAAGVTLAVGLLASIGAFLSTSKATMTTRSIATVAVDWQVEVQRSASPDAVRTALAADPHVVGTEPVLFARTTGFQATVGATTQTTGAGVVLGIADTYRTSFPATIRNLVGATTGSLLFQQTAANLQAVPGTAVQVGRDGLAASSVNVEGVVDLPQADSLFQQVGAAVGATPQAPPDNVLVVSAATWHRLFDPLAAVRPDLVRTQFHVRLDHRLPPDPAAAYSTVIGQARNLEVRAAGGALVGDNLGATLAAARADALYAQVLFLFLGLPGAVLAGLLTGAVAAAGRDRRRADQALLRARGATTRTLVRLAVAEAALLAVLGAGAGLLLAAAVGRALFGSGRLGATTGQAVGWAAGAAAAGAFVAVASVAIPAIRDARELTVGAARRSVGHAGTPWWMRWFVDLALVGGGALVWWLSSRNGYRLVLAVEGVPAISVSYWAFAGPALMWIGGGLLANRLATLLLRRGRPVVRTAIRPLAGSLAGTVAADLQRRRRPLARAVALIALTVGFAASSAVFNATYRQQAEVDAVLTNGADVTVTPFPGSDTAPSRLNEIANLTGVRHVEAIQHRFGYVGADLQDLFGVDPATIVGAGKLQDAYVRGGSATQLIATLAAQPDGLLVSAETVKDFQLAPGDLVNLRLQDALTKQYVPVPFHYVGVVTEFPTAPRDSFLVANASYIAAHTGSAAVGAYLVDTGGSHVTQVAHQLSGIFGTSATVTDIASSRRVVGSSLTAVDLRGLTRVELGFAVALGAAAAGLTLWLGLRERRRTFAIVAALGATRRQIGAFVWAEAAVITIVGIIAGAVGAVVLSRVLVDVLNGVFDPPPSTLAVPWRYLTIVLAVAVAATATACVAAPRSARAPDVKLLRANDA